MRPINNNKNKLNSKKIKNKNLFFKQMPNATK